MLRYKLRTLLILLAVGPPLLPICYVLSAGPASWLAQNNYVDREWLVPLYRPLGNEIRKNQKFADFMFLYIDRCGATPTFSPVNTSDTPWLPPDLPAE